MEYQVKFTFIDHFYFQVVHYIEFHTGYFFTAGVGGLCFWQVFLFTVIIYYTTKDY